MVDTNPYNKIDYLGTETLSECQDKEERSRKAFWEARVAKFGNHKSIFLDTAEERIKKFTENHIRLIYQMLEDEDVLEIGCGYGRLLDIYAETCCSYVGVDFVPALVEEAQNRLDKILKHEEDYVGGLKMEVREADLRNLPFEDETFTAIVGVTTITSVECNFPQVLDELKRVLKPKGFILWLEEEWMRIDYKDNEWRVPKDW
jgi:ubiquinone/menaquinone biosynthesis C-methylase UbiE